MRKIVLGVISYFMFSVCIAGQEKAIKSESSGKKEPPEIGNFALPGTQQPGAFLSFGQNVIEKSQVQLYCLADAFIGTGKHSVDMVPAIVYGLTDSFSAFFNVPIAVSYRQEENRSAGFEDVFLQFEYAFSNVTTDTFTGQSTFVGTVTFPTGSTLKNPNLGVGASSFFLGATFSRTYINWFAFTSHGVTLNTTHDETKYGNQLLYQLGIGRNICSIPSKWIFAWLIEADGQYLQKNTIEGEKDPNSGGNILFITPSLWVSSNHLILQLGIGAPVVQHLMGTQDKIDYLLALNIGWTFG